MDKDLTTYLAIAITSNCNYKCFYCKEGGENIEKCVATLSFEDLKKIINNAYNIGIRNFRITGGEPTTVEYFGKLIKFIMEKGNTKVRINTNGFRILEYVGLFTKYKDKIDIVMSVDSISEYLNGVHFPKYLSPNIINITKALKDKGISVRYNVVVTKLNEDEVKELVLKAVKELHVNVKLLDLNRYSSYIGYKEEVRELEALKMWEKLYVPMEKFTPFLKEIANRIDTNWTTGLIRKKTRNSNEFIFLWR